MPWFGILSFIGWKQGLLDGWSHNIQKYQLLLLHESKDIVSFYIFYSSRLWWAQKQNNNFDNPSFDHIIKRITTTKIRRLNNDSNSFFYNFAIRLLFKQMKRIT
jgi:hypothetical protein